MLENTRPFFPALLSTRLVLSLLLFVVVVVCGCFTRGRAEPHTVYQREEEMGKIQICLVRQKKSFEAFTFSQPEGEVGCMEVQEGRINKGGAGPAEDA
ncbi:hypothetical protein QBC46DRAFT_395172 [Diplogelasinospora grovesii]|uniref:Transmembrane protein n=1 Tax=Diplogelasinospora grovesii TaxID=303347 RepID=A0AAN6N1G6_9PEZI|nr:hypothetical protein QBC46DRAFT_395172 [Diplogelasinospora grovesii]